VARDNGRIPREIRKEANKLGPGRYMDPSNGRVYIDSADMDDFFEEMIDGTANADAERIAEMERLRKLPRPPPEIQDQANDHLKRHAARILQKQEDGGLSGGGGWRERAEKRQKHLLARQSFRRQIGGELEPEDLQELLDLAEALAPAQQENEDDGIEGTASGD